MSSRRAHLPDKPLSLLNEESAEFIKSVNLIVGLDQLLERLCSHIAESFGTGKIAIVLFEPITDRYTIRYSRIDKGEQRPAYTFSRTDPLIRWLNVNHVPLDVPREPEVVKYLSEEEREVLHSNGIVLVVPLIVLNRLSGVVMMGGRANGGDYSAPEVEFLSRLSSQTAIAIEHAVNAEYQEGRLKRVLQADKLATVGELAAGAAHEIRNPLTSIRSTIQWLKRDLPAEKHPMADGIIEEVDRIDGIIKGLLSLSRTSDLRLSPLDLQSILGETLTLLDPECRSHDVAIERDFASSPCTMLGDSSQLKQLFLNILLNAIQANSPGGTVHVAVLDRGSNASAAQPSLEVAITDTGPGIPEDILPKVFDPFFTTKDNGTGLGLSISYGIASKHGGEIEIVSRNSGVKHGTTVKVRLPKAGRQTP